MSGLTLGLLAETTCLLKQQQTISQQRAQIQNLKQRLTCKKQKEQALPKKTLTPPVQPATPVAKGKEPEPAKPQPSQPSVPAAKEKEPEPSIVPDAEKKVSPDTSGKPEGGNVHKEDLPNEK